MRETFGALGALVDLALVQAPQLLSLFHWHVHRIWRMKVFSCYKHIGFQNYIGSSLNLKCACGLWRWDPRQILGLPRGTVARPRLGLPRYWDPGNLGERFGGRFSGKPSESPESATTKWI
eukprot:1366833-Amorphochlora_amoeboformis.AAC.2